MTKFLNTASPAHANALIDLAALMVGEAVKAPNTPSRTAPAIGKAVAAVRRAGESVKASHATDPALDLLRSAWDSLKQAQRGLPRLTPVHYAHLRKAHKALVLATGK